MKAIIFLSVAIALAALGVRLYFRLSTLLTESPLVYKNHESCLLVESTEEMRGAEDFVIVMGDLLITGTDDRILLWEISVPSKTPDGHLFLIDSKTNKARLLPLLQFPEGVAFHPHGLFLLEEGEGDEVELRLYVVNHAYSRGGERIDVFKITGRSFDDVTASYSQSIIPPLFSSLTGTINSVIALSSNAIYFTQYRAFHDMLDGRDFHSQDVWGKIHGVGNILDMFVLEGWSHVFYCEFDGKQSGNVTDANCFKASSGFNGPNGITRDEEGYIYVALPVQKTVEIFVQEKDKRLTHVYSLPTPLAVDNLKYNKQFGVIHAATLEIPSFIKLIHEITATQDRPKDNVIPGGNMNIKKVKGQLEFTVTETHLVPGKLISGIAGSSRVGNRMYLGSWYDKNVLSCPV